MKHTITLTLHFATPIVSRATLLRAILRGTIATTNEGMVLRGALETSLAELARDQTADAAILDAYLSAGSFKGAARVLGIARTTVRDRIARMNLAAQEQEASGAGVANVSGELAIVDGTRGGSAFVDDE